MVVLFGEAVQPCWGCESLGVSLEGSHSHTVYSLLSLLLLEAVAAFSHLPAPVPAVTLLQPLQTPMALKL